MQYSEIMIRYGELSTKGKNRMRFINKLRNNISDVLSIYPQVKVTADRDRAHAYLNGADYTAVAESLFIRLKNLLQRLRLLSKRLCRISTRKA